MININAINQKALYKYFSVILFFLTSCHNFISLNQNLEEERLRSAIRIHPKHELGYVRLAQYLENRHRYTEAFSVLHRGQKQIPNSIAPISF